MHHESRRRARSKKDGSERRTIFWLWQITFILNTSFSSTSSNKKDLQFAKTFRYSSCSRYCRDNQFLTVAIIYSAATTTTTTTTTHKLSCPSVRIFPSFDTYADMKMDVHLPAHITYGDRLLYLRCIAWYYYSGGALLLMTRFLLSDRPAGRPTNRQSNRAIMDVLFPAQAEQVRPSDRPSVRPI